MFDLVPDAENAHFHAEEDEEVHCWPLKEWVQRYHARGAPRQLLRVREQCGVGMAPGESGCEAKPEAR